MMSSAIKAQPSFHSANEAMMAEAKIRASDFDSHEATPYSILSPAASINSNETSHVETNIIVNGNFTIFFSKLTTSFLLYYLSVKPFNGEDN